MAGLAFEGRVDPRKAAIWAVIWPAAFVVLAVVIRLIWGCSDTIGCLTRSGVALVPVAVAAPTAAALFGAGVTGPAVFVVGFSTSILLWCLVGWWLARLVQKDGDGWQKWWQFYLILAGTWTVIIVGMFGIAALRTVG